MTTSSGDDGERDRAWAAVEFLTRLRADEARGRVRTLREYLEDWPGHEELIAREYLETRALDRRADELDGSSEQFGPFRIERELGRGAEGDVFLAYEAMLDRRVALKVIRTRLGELEEARFLHAASLAARFDHPNLCRVFDAGRSAGAVWISMQYVPGRSLARVLEQRRLASEPLPPPQAAKLVAGVLRGLEHAHRLGVVHRDVKPGNIVLRDDGSPVLCDFGIAKDADSNTAWTTASEFAGTLRYMAPEVIDGDVGSMSADLWACAVVLYECVTLSPPFDGTSAASIMDSIRRHESWDHDAWRELPRDLQAILAVALHKDPARRYRDAPCFRDDLERFVAGDPVSVKRPGLARRVLCWSRREPALASGIMVAALALVVISATTLWSLARERELRSTAQQSVARTRAAANSMLFEIDDALDEGKGNVAARLRLVEKAKDLLVVLREDDPNDPALRRELALAWMRLGDLRGHGSVANRGDEQGAAVCFAQAEGLARESLTSDPRALEVLVACLIKRGDLAIADASIAEPLYREAIERAESDSLRRLRAIAKSQLAMLERDRKNYEAASAWIESSRLDFESAARTQDAHADRLALTDLEATVLASCGEIERAIESLRSALDHEEGVPARVRASMHLHLAQCLEMAGDSESATASIKLAERTWRDRLRFDPGDRGAVRQLVRVLEEDARLSLRHRELERAHAVRSEALRLAEGIGDTETVKRIRLNLAER
ncbi:MAG: serine/threonine protein kinase [Planctomycetes bacterium]|nr:serine/threonine protein kinase [Planctomycetota bacterium]